ncbi:MAG: sensor histidine kinase, partial [bacterium]
NNLSTIIGMLYAEQRRASVKRLAGSRSILKSLVSRVQGLSTVHSMLSASEWRAVPLQELCEQVIKAALEGLSTEKCLCVEVSPSPIRVTSAQAHHLALIVNELATNTIKHVLGERDKARIQVDFRCEGEIVRLRFRDDGPGYPPEILHYDQERFSVGFVLIQNIVKKNLHGDLHLTNENGAVAEITFETAKEENHSEV